MQMTKLRGVVNLVAVNKTFLRCSTSMTKENTEAVQNVKSFEEIPGPPSLPFLGSILSFLPGGKLSGLKGIQLNDKMYQLYGPIVKAGVFMGSPPMIMLFDADATEQILRSENTMPIRLGFASLEYYRKNHNKTYDPKRQTGLITDHGESWKDFRSKVNPIMMQPKTIKLYKDVLDEVANDMVAKLRTDRDENNMITKNIDFEMNLWALESIGVVALGSRLNCFNPKLPADSPVRKLIKNVHAVFQVMSELDFAPSPWRYFATPAFNNAMKVYEEQETLSKFFIDQAMKNMEKSEKKNVPSNSEKPVLEKLLEIDVRIAHIMASDMLMAGVDTAANTVLATFYLLAKNPEKQKKLREEVLAKDGRNAYLRACIKESMRMLPVVNGNVRLTTKEYDLLGYRIPKDVMIVLCHQYMANMKEHYPRPDEFIPERWLTDKEDPLYYGNTHPFVNIPFGYGVRMCIGRRIAELEMQTFVSKVVENFDIGWTGGPINITANALNYITGPFHFVFKDL
ncbi:cytochrome P450 CYP12A2-like [Leguminivora glycinivorella]|uniref:cytochrome P450 CYP12A2-like n=1 Tax=Leguminivora glycinivorella TaxID=1035111 RepID=UPI00200CB40B|nr:cytochrome P450 CYP12A2-like [Leguminivora glycinivorella]